MQYRRCRCGKAERWDSGECVRPCEGCDECQTTYAQRAEDHKQLQPHTFADYFMGGNDPNPVKRCVDCNHIERKAMRDGRIRVLVDDREVTLPGQIEGYMLKAAAGIDPHRTIWKRMPAGTPETIIHDTKILDLMEGDEFWTSPPATFG